jgi:aminoglycoside phosphotransferase (APT) family kinase protein
MSDFRTLPATERVTALLESLEPHSRLTDVSLLPKSFSNASYLIEATTGTGAPFKIVLRQYNPANESPERKTLREFRALEVLQASNVPAPKPLLMDETGERLGAPGIVTSFADGKQFIAHNDLRGWAKMLAQTLANIHQVSCDLSAEYWMDGNTEVLWFSHSDTLLERMVPYEDGEMVYKTVRDYVSHLTSSQSVFSHIDFWSGNILWHNASISAVLDWEEAARCDPGYDLAYARMEMFLLGHDDAAKTLLQSYEAETGKRVENLAFWELAASVRSMPDPAGWIPEWAAFSNIDQSDNAVRQRLRDFISVARRQLGV